MVIYDLECQLGHRFEGWFPHHDAFESQQNQGLIACSQCGCQDVHKIPTGAHVGLSGRHENNRQTTSKKTDVQNIPVDPILFLKSINRYVKENFKDVGKSFVDEAIQMHQGEKPQQAIFGEITPEGHERLQDEGIDYTVVPQLGDEFEN